MFVWNSLYQCVSVNYVKYTEEDETMSENSLSSAGL